MEERTGGRVEVPQGVMDVRVFFRGPTDEEMVAILRRHDVDYVLVPTGSRLEDREISPVRSPAVHTPVRRMEDARGPIRRLCRGREETRGV